MKRTAFRGANHTRTDGASLRYAMRPERKLVSLGASHGGLEAFQCGRVAGQPLHWARTIRAVWRPDDREGLRPLEEAPKREFGFGGSLGRRGNSLGHPGSPFFHGIAKREQCVRV